MSVLLSSYSGLAAFNLNGTTPHSALALPITQASSNFNMLSDEISHKFVLIFFDLQLIIIDEISKVGARTLHQIDQRLWQIFKTSKACGGLSVITVGDFNQLKPTGDSYVFEAD
ncbi:unnamed protein product [Brachionus calyciflorus]|uniref:ATP-dependent DNA helicase n=1 Tax=Brachionus calyciflorus TaxID=104777 RepID=A0A814FBG8_9BILA|nr:unnamed protein product [Brachionus calyciflorus]